MTIPQICQTIWQAERKLDLFSWQERGIWVWPLLRMELYYRITFQLGFYHEASTQPSESPKPLRAMSRWQRFWHLRRLRKPTPALFITGDRLNKKTGQDVILELFFEREPTRKLLPVAAQELDLAVQKKKEPEHQRYQRDLGIEPIAGKQPELSSASQEKISQVANFFEMELGFMQDWTAHVRGKLRQFDKTLAYYLGLFRTQKPQRIYLTVSYGKEPIIAAAHQLGITVIEAQHGTVHPYHLGYSYPQRPDGIPYYPDKFLAWAPFWTNTFPFLLSAERIEHTGNARMRDQLANLPKAKEKKDQVVIISQYVLSNELAAALLAVGIADLGMPVYFKLHPLETGKLQENIAALEALPHVRVVSDVPLLPLLAESRYAVGVFSTSIFEALALGCRIALVELPGIESMESVIAKFSIPVLERGTTSTLAEALERTQLPDSSWNSLF
jgi:hypothetical protein